MVLVIMAVYYDSCFVIMAFFVVKVVMLQWLFCCNNDCVNMSCYNGCRVVIVAVL